MLTNRPLGTVATPDTRYREPPPDTERADSQPPTDGTDEEIEEWASQFVDTILRRGPRARAMPND